MAAAGCPSGAAVKGAATGCPSGVVASGAMAGGASRGAAAGSRLRMPLGCRGHGRDDRLPHGSGGQVRGGHGRNCRLPLGCGGQGAPLARWVKASCLSVGFIQIPGANWSFHSLLHGRNW